ncbi:MAG: DUF1461 domain-containing protein [Actinobacteria bacterium]|nr:DUF1461 domain-containing protein [Actinomycetota bacterium]
MALLSFFLIFVIIFSPLSYYVYNRDFYISLYEKNGVYEILDKQDAEKITESVFDFFKSGKQFESFKLKGEIGYFNQNEISHLNDVRILISRILLTFYISSLLSVLFILLLIERKYISFLKNFFLAILISSSAVIFMLLILFILGNNFWLLFEDFHLIFFPQGNWAFPEGSLIITIFPFGFFYDFFFKLVITSAIITAVMFFAGISGIIISNKLQKRKTDNNVHTKQFEITDKQGKTD